MNSLHKHTLRVFCHQVSQAKACSSAPEKRSPFAYIEMGIKKGLREHFEWTKFSFFCLALASLISAQLPSHPEERMCSPSGKLLIDAGISFPSQLLT